MSTFVLTPVDFLQRILTLCRKTASRSCPHPSFSSGAVMDEELVLHVVILVVILWLFCVALYCHFTPHVRVK